jgi:hypothetical protein
MATAMAFPEDFKRGRKKSGSIVDSNNNFDRSTLSRARFVLRNNPSAADSIFPQYALDVMAGRMTLADRCNLLRSEKSLLLKVRSHPPPTLTDRCNPIAVAH